MKTLKALKITSILQSIFCFFCTASSVCFAVSYFCDSRTTFNIANIMIYGWILNPIAIISFIICLALFLAERKQSEAKQVLGKKWVWIFIWPVITTVFYIIACILTVAFTGGV